MGELGNLGRVFTERVIGLRPVRDQRGDGRRFASHLNQEKSGREKKPSEEPTPPPETETPPDPDVPPPHGPTLGKVLNYEA